MWPFQQKYQRDPVEEICEQEQSELQDDREFWECCISWMIDSGDPINIVIHKADELTEARRERFPLGS